MKQNAIRIPCPRCLRAPQTCYCSQVQQFSHPVKFVILQHPREARHGLGTGRMAYLCLEGSELIRGFEFGQDERFQAHLSDETRQLMVLYPGARATMASADNAEKLRASFEDRPATVLVIDGTWPQAKKMFHGTPELQTLPWLAFETERRSEYQFRLQPDPLCLSTIEAVHELIDAFARHGVCQPTPSGAHDNLLTVFRFMNEVQVRYMNDPNVPGYRRRPHRPMSEIPTAKRWERRRLLFRPAAEPE